MSNRLIFLQAFAFGTYQEDVTIPKTLSLLRGTERPVGGEHRENLALRRRQPLLLGLTPRLVLEGEPELVEAGREAPVERRRIEYGRRDVAHDNELSFGLRSCQCRARRRA